MRYHGEILNELSILFSLTAVGSFCCQDFFPLVYLNTPMCQRTESMMLFELHHSTNDRIKNNWFLVRVFSSMADVRCVTRTKIFEVVVQLFWRCTVGSVLIVNRNNCHKYVKTRWNNPYHTKNTKKTRLVHCRGPKWRLAAKAANGG